MKISILILLALLFALVGCEKNNNDTSVEKFVPTDVLVKIKGYYTIDKVFDFINSFEHEVENIHSQVYTSDLPSDSLRYVLDYLNAKPYTHDGNAWLVVGYQHYQTKVITIFPKFFNIKNADFQKDWLESMEILKLNEQTEGETNGCIIYFHVPEGQEQLWVKRFENYEFVEWADVNHLIDYQTWP
ncbi:MAG TPA: hypothetical protein VFG54_21280 [Prolixibacteraceae bacterium]|nr:hypothetical protein [Prolixibacteraceae bacterium]